MQKGLPVLDMGPCGACNMCCSYYEIQENRDGLQADRCDFSKPAGELCRYYRFGCSRHGIDKPPLCQNYQCAYMDSLPQYRGIAHRPDISGIMVQWHSGSLRASLVPDRFIPEKELRRPCVTAEQATRLKEEVVPKLDLTWHFRQAACRHRPLRVMVEAYTLAHYTAAEVLEHCLVKGIKFELDRRHVTAYRTVRYPPGQEDDLEVEIHGQPYWHRLGIDGQIHLQSYRVLYGWRLRAGYVSDRLGYTLDWCLGDRDCNSAAFQYTAAALVHRIDENWQAGRGHFHGLPPVSSVKPLFRDPEFVAQVFAGMAYDEAIFSGERDG